MHVPSLQTSLATNMLEQLILNWYVLFIFASNYIVSHLVIVVTSYKMLTAYSIAVSEPELPARCRYSHRPGDQDQFEEPHAAHEDLRAKEAKPRGRA